MDLLVGGVLAMLAVPLIVAMAVAVGISLRTWPFFTQERIGRDGRMFRIAKIRTLPPQAPRYATHHDLGQIPHLCRALRRLHLDELPQLFLVVVGRLSLVGPRPEMPFLAKAMDPRLAALRTSVRPGCTGLWQVSPVSNRPIGHAPEYDGWYVENGNLRVDSWVLWRTALVMSGLGGPVRLSDVPRWATWRLGLRDTGLPTDGPAAADAAS